jgi:hypothetical protein
MVQYRPLRPRFCGRCVLRRVWRALTCSPPEPKGVWEWYDGVLVKECPHGGMVKANDTAAMPLALPEIVHFDMTREEKACHERLNALGGQRYY